MTVLSGQPPVPTGKVDKRCFMMQSILCEDLKMFEGLRSVLTCGKKVIRVCKCKS